jgi:hypothetical protein
MAFGSMRIGSYILSRRIFLKREGGSMAHAETILELRPHASDNGAVATALVSFVADPRAGQLSGDYVSTFLAADEFHLWYEVLRAEDPVWFAWDALHTDGTVTFVALGTGIEPPGEGIDVSP